MLRASIEFSGADAGLRGIAEGARAGDAGIAHGRLLTAFVDAAIRGDPTERSRAREALRAAAGAEVVVDAAAVIGNFERMVRIADGTGIPLDGLTATVADGIRAELGLDAFASRRTKPRALWSRMAGPMVRGLALRTLRLAGRRGD